MQERSFVMRVKDVMTENPQVVRPQTSLKEVAETMKSLDVGVLPVCDNDRLVGMITDRDIVVRAEAEGLSPSAVVDQAMTPDVTFCFEEDDLDSAVKLMEDKQIRRLPVLNTEHRLVGIVSLGDLAVSGDQQTAGEVLERVSEPAKPNR
jgi:CBS domain-containing protein